MITFHKESIVKQDGNKLTCRMLVIEDGTKNHFITQHSGTIKNGKIRLMLDKVIKVDFPKTSWNHFCFRNFRGDLIIDEANNMLIMDLENYGTDLIYEFNNKTYLDGYCHPTFKKLIRRYRDIELESTTIENSISFTDTDEDKIVSINKKEIKLFTKNVKIKVWDRYDKDGDIIIQNLEVTKKGEFFDIELVSGINIIEIEALNEGNVSPNTSAIRILTNKEQHEIILSAKKGEKDSLKIILD